MKTKELNYNIKVCQPGELPEVYQKLLAKARQVVEHAYAPYSQFHVGAAVLLEDGTVVIGANQENASYPVGVCAERVAITSASAQHPRVPVKAVAISVKGKNIVVNTPVSPCGICRQTILEYELTQKKDIELILQGEIGDVYWVPSAKTLLPLYFSGVDLKNE
ncbi:MAG TPA: cytidine deaminase [Chitinophagales bacterium]|nr:cytidine deaminase [Chitinophagales bacterium]